mgnify:CR=1 FL=1
MKKTLMISIIIGSLFLTVGCENEKTVDNGGTKELSYTNKYECSRLEKYTTQQVFYRTKQDPKNEEDSGKDALELEISRLYDFNEAGDKLVAYYDIMTYNYLVDYDMEAQKKYFEDECKNEDKDTYKSCVVSLNGKTITVTLTVDLNSESGKESFSGITLDSVKENYAGSPYTCK